MLYQRILCATDGSDSSERALEHAARLARHTGAELHVVHVDEGARAATMLAGEFIAVPPRERERLSAEQASRAAGAEGLTAVIHQVAAGHLSIAGRIARLAERLDIDVIVVGSRGRSAVGGAMLGSVSQRLPHESERPIVVVPAEHPAPRLSVGRLRRETAIVTAS